MSIQLNRFPSGVTKAVTLSFDDGRVHDRRLVEMLNTYGLKSTFHLNSGMLDKEGYITSEEVKTLFSGHEVSAHTTTHPLLDQSPREQIIHEVLDDCRRLEALLQYPIKGMSYPYGTFNERIIETLRSIGMEYSRTVHSHGSLHMPENWLSWHPTCHHKQMLEHGEKLLSSKEWHNSMCLLYVWGHSYEFEQDNNWELVERFGELIGGKEDIWYATNADIYAYKKAIDSLRFSGDCNIVHNPSALDVWISVKGEPVCIRSGAVVHLR